VHRVLPSSCIYFACAQRIRFHWVSIGDSREVVTPFMQVGTYPTRNFATLEPSGVQLPFTGASNQILKPSSSLTSTGQVSDALLPKKLAASCVFTKQSPPSICATKPKFGTPSPKVTGPFCRVPSIEFSQRLSILCQSTCVGLSTVYYNIFFTEI